MRKESSRFIYTIQSAVFLVGCFLYVLFWVDPELLFYAHGQLCFDPVYVSGSNLFSDRSAYPGEPADFLAAFLSYYFCFTWLGSLIITGLAGLLTWQTDWLIKAMAGRRFRVFRFAPALLMLIQYARFNCPLSDILALIIVLFILGLYMHLALSARGPRLIMFAACSALVYGLAAQFYLIFVFLGILYEFVIRRKPLVGICGGIIFLFVPYFLNIFYDQILEAAYLSCWLNFTYDTDSYGKVLKICLYLVVPLIGTVCGIWHVLSKDRSPDAGKNFRVNRKKHQKKDRSAESWWHKYRQNPRAVVVSTLLLLIISSTALWLNADPIRRSHLRIIYLARHEQWPQLLQEAREIPKSNFNLYVCFDVNRALYHTGQLSNAMFTYPQHPFGLLLTTEESRGYERIRRSMVLADLLYEIGYINNSEDLCCEVMAVSNYCPWILKRLARAYLVKQQPGAARTCLNKLLNDMLYRDWAQGLLDQLEKDPLLAEDRGIQLGRLCMPKIDNIKKSENSRDFFQPLFNANRNNRMAYEYLLAVYMLTNDLDSFVVIFRQLNDFNSPEIPRHHQEALLLYSHAKGKKVNLKRQQLSRENLARFDNFFQIYKKYKGDRRAAEKLLAKDFGDTYYYYYLFTLPTLQKNISMKDK